jgi:hypothetical protein
LHFEDTETMRKDKKRPEKLVSSNCDEREVKPPEVNRVTKSII